MTRARPGLLVLLASSGLTLASVLVLVLAIAQPNAEARLVYPGLDGPAVEPVKTTAVSKRVLVRTEDGESVVMEVHGENDQETVVLMPDGRLAWLERAKRGGRPLSYTDRPFEPLSADALKSELEHKVYPGFRLKQTPHYLVFYKCSPEFANASATLLESLYNGLSKEFKERGMAVKETPLPLVAVVFHTEAEFRAFRPIQQDVQAYYDIISNHVFFYEHTDRERRAPEIELLRKPQTVAHEGTHQILQNIGVQPRLAPWPLWLVEGLAEYCSPTSTKKGAQWAGLGAVNPLHMATIRDLSDPLTYQFQRLQGRETVGAAVDPRTGVLERLLTSPDLTPTDYAWSWALVHYLAGKQPAGLVAYLKELSTWPPLDKKTPLEQLAMFRQVFGQDLGKIERAMRKHLGALKKYEDLPYYAVVFEERVGAERRRGAFVSQSPSFIRQRIEALRTPGGGYFTWRATPFPSRSRATLAGEQWVQGR